MHLRLISTAVKSPESSIYIEAALSWVFASMTAAHSRLSSSPLPARYDDTREFEPWLTRICVNTYRNTLKRASKSPLFDGFTDSAEKDAALLAAPAPEREDYGALREAIDRLPGKLRTAVVLFYFRDMDLKAAALALGIPVGTVKSRLNKSKKLLKEALSYEADIPF